MLSQKWHLKNITRSKKRVPKKANIENYLENTANCTVNGKHLRTITIVWKNF